MIIDDLYHILFITGLTSHNILSDETIYLLDVVHWSLYLERALNLVCPSVESGFLFALEMCI